MRSIEVCPKKRRRRRLTFATALGVLGISLASSVANAFPPPPNDPAQPQTKVTICHVTPGNIVANTPNANGDVSGHAGHPNDIIPPFWFLENGVPTQFAGLNWNADGQAIYANDCEGVTPTSTTGPTTTAEATTTTTTTTTAPPTTMESTSTSAGETTTTGTSPPTTDGQTTTTRGAVTTHGDSTLPPTGASTNANVIGAALLLALAGGIALAVARRKPA